jgi:hypothetical protein
MSLLHGVLNGATTRQVFHGRRGPAMFAPVRPIFATLKPSHARFYAYETGGKGAPTVHELRVRARRFAALEDLMAAVEAVGATEDDVEAQGVYFQTDNDFLYVPSVQVELERRGFDAYEGLDVLERSDIPILVVWHPEQVEVAESMELPER